jgi:hypothetical protein
MDKKKRNIIIGWCIAIALVCIYVPWKIDSKGYRIAMGYSFLWSPPDTSLLDIGRVFLEITVITVLAVVVYLLSVRQNG